MQPVDSELTVLARSVVEPMGFELVGVEYFRRGGAGAILRVYIDRAEGITLDDCAAVSHQLSGVLDVEDPLSGRYDLEISSPGLDRPLVFPEHFNRFRGHQATLRLAERIEGRRRLVGELLGCEDGVVGIAVDGRRWDVPLAAIESARLVAVIPDA